LYCAKSTENVLNIISNSKNINGNLTLIGTIFIISYSYYKDNLYNAILSIKSNIIENINSRIELLFEDGNQENISLSNKILKLPKKVIFPVWGSIYFCDFIYEYETLEVKNKFN
jgi:hypothetical protein